MKVIIMPGGGYTSVSPGVDIEAEAKRIGGIVADESEIPPVPESEMRESEIAQDKQYLADTDWIVTKIGEAQLIGEDIQPLLDKYSSQIAEREMARVRIRINEGRE